MEYTLNINLNNIKKSDQEQLKETTQGSTAEPNKVETTKETPSVTKTVAASVAGYALGQVVTDSKSVASYEINRIGSVYGNYKLQNEIQNAMTLGGYATNIATMGAAGFALGGVAGAAVGVAASIGKLAVQAIENYRDSMYADAIDRIESQRDLERLGMLASSNSR